MLYRNINARLIDCLRAWLHVCMQCIYLVMKYMQIAYIPDSKATRIGIDIDLTHRRRIDIDSI